MAAADTVLNSSVQETTLPSQSNEGNLNVASGNRFDVPIPVQAGGSFKLGIGTQK